jgi:hypothetical protein
MSAALLTAQERKTLFDIIDERCFEPELNPAEWALRTKLDVPNQSVGLSSEEVALAEKYAEARDAFTIRQIRLMRKLKPGWPL